MPDRLPPLTALRAFEAAARHMSFSKAAAELFVTPAALSYQIKQLEEHLGIPVFRRLNRAVELTEAGQALRPGVEEAFAELRQAVRAVTKLRDHTGLTITAGPAFTAKWLSPRFFRFANAHPDIELRFVASLKQLDFVRDGVDAAIRFGETEPHGMYSEILSDEWVTPVCVPEMAEGIRAAGHLADQHLLHDESIDFLSDPPDWAKWLRQTGDPADPTHGTHFTNADHAIDVALEGAGVALGRIVLIERYLKSGRLVAPFDSGMRMGAHYRFLCPEGAEDSGTTGLLLAWLREEFEDLAVYGEEFRLFGP